MSVVVAHELLEDSNEVTPTQNEHAVQTLAASGSHEALGDGVGQWRPDCPRKPPGGRSTDPADMPTGKEIYATRDVDRLQRMATEHGDAIGRYATAILDTPLP